MKRAVRDFELERDLDAVKRIWQEVGWVSDESEIAMLDHFFAAGRTRVGTLDDVAECAVHTTPGRIYLGDQSLSLCAVTAVTTSRVARSQRFAQELTAEQLLHAQTRGAQVSALGMFDQGFYDKLGFGTGAYDFLTTFDPDLLQVDHRVPPPERFSIDDFEALHQALYNRKVQHGGVSLDPPEIMRAELGFSENGFGLGYRDESGQVSHFLWLSPEGERGPYRIVMQAYQNTDQLMELLGLLKSLADQVYAVIMMEPADIQLQSLLRRPFRHKALTKDGKLSNNNFAAAWYQLRLLELQESIKAVPVVGEVEFHLSLTDPLDQFREEGSHGQGMTGEYRISLGSQNSAERVTGDSGLPILQADIRAITRLLFGVATAESLQVTDQFTLPAELGKQLDRVLKVPRPVPGLDF